MNCPLFIFVVSTKQVSHHPPVSACHAIAKNWTWWQDLRVKTKFWGKSMEFQPDGIVHLELVLPDGTHELYTWNKVHLNTLTLTNVCLA